MRPGTPGFVGARLREAREARGLTASSLAEMVGVSRQVISQYENAVVSPGPDSMYRIASVLNLPIDFFSLPARVKDDATVFYRSLAAATKMARTRSEQRFEWLKDITAYVLQFLELPLVNLPPPPTVPHVGALSSDAIEEAAIEARRYWKLGDGPISNVAWLLENHGAILSRGILESETLDAFSQLGCGRPIIFLGADKESAVRSRFDAAHELAHMVLHRGLDRQVLRNVTELRRIEQQAHAYAAAFLLPAQTFMGDLMLPNLDRMRALKPKWRVSIAAMIMRTKHLRLITEDQQTALWTALARRGWRRREPLDDELPVEQPRVLRKAIQMLIEEGIKAKADIANDLRLMPCDLEQLIGLPENYLTDGAVPPLRLVRHAKADHGQDSAKGGTSSTLIDFRAR